MNALAKYALGITNIDKGKIEAFVSGLKSNIANDVMIGDHAPNTYLKALSKAQRLKAMRLKITNEQSISNQPSLVTLVQRAVSCNNHKGSSRDIVRVKGHSHSK